MSDLLEQFTEVRNELAEVKGRINCVSFFRRKRKKIDFKEDVDVFLEKFETGSVHFDEQDQLLIKTNKNFLEEFYLDLQDAIDNEEIKNLLDDKVKGLEKKVKRLEKKEKRLEKKEKQLKEIEKALIEEKTSMNQKDTALQQKDTALQQIQAESAKTKNLMFENKSFLNIPSSVITNGISSFVFDEMNPYRDEVARIFLNPHVHNAGPGIDVSYYKFFDKLQSMFSNPKDFSWSTPLVWTQQTGDIFSELEIPPKSDIVRCQILAGPSGMGKSSVCLLLALRLYGARNPVLYISDAGNVWSNCKTSEEVLVHLIQIFLKINKDILTSDIIFCLKNIIVYPVWSCFAKVLNFVKAVVLLDEHGHAYNQITDLKLDPLRFFPILIPNYYIDYLNIRTVFAGSNQGRFEIQLNDTYLYCKRFITPFTREEASCYLFLSSQKITFTMEIIHYLSNFVPLEMKILFQCNKEDEYIRTRVDAMSIQLEKTPKEALTYLQNFFRSSSMIMGSTNISFLDIGLIYRSQKAPYTSVIAFPLCYPAQIALIRLWRKFDQTSKKVWSELKIQCSGSQLGIHFENLVWDVLIYRGFNQTNRTTIDCASIELKVRTTSKFVFNACFCYASQLGKEDYKGVCTEIIFLRRYIYGKGSVLYRFPDGFKTCDFAIFNEKDFVVIQVSVSTLTAYGNPDLNSISLLIGTAVSKYLYFTSNPELHPNVKWDKKDLMFIVDADNWFNFEE